MSGHTDGVNALLQAADRLERLVDLFERVVVLAPGNGTVQQVTVPQAPPQRAERLVLVMAGIAAVIAFFAGSAVTASVQQGQRISDLVVLQASLRAETKAEVLAERTSRERFEAWAAQEANTMRTFAKTGVLAPMQPRPLPQTVEPKASP